MLMGGLKRLLYIRGMPLVLLIAEINLTLMLSRNLSNFYTLTVYIKSDLISVATSVGLLSLTAVMTLLTINTMIGLPSSKKTSWRGAVRSTIVLIVSFTLFNLLKIDMFRSTAYWMPFLALMVLLILFLPSVRRYYTPLMTEYPPLSDWIRYLTTFGHDPGDDYRFVYKDGEVDGPEDGPGPNQR